MRPPLSVLIFTAIAALAPDASAARVRVRARATLEARAVPRAGGVELRGILEDDGGRPIGQARILLTPLGSGPLPKPESCARASRVPIFSTGAGYGMDTDGAGSFCVRIPTPTSASFRVRFDGDRYYDAAQQELVVDSSRRSLALKFSPEPRLLSLDQASHGVWLETRVEPPEPEALPESIHLELLLIERAGAEKKLREQTVVAGERVRLLVESGDLGEPGPATLVATFRGSDTLSPAKKSTVIQRRARVKLAAAGPVSGGDPSEGIQIPVAVGSTFGAISGGAVEAAIGDESLGTAPVTAGAARVVAIFDAPHAATIPITLRYLPDSPWWEADDPITVPVVVAPPSPWRRLPWVVAAVGIALWVVRGWRRPARSEKKPTPEEATAPTGRASVDVIERGPARGGWKGRILDAHEGSAIAEARVRVLIPAFGGGGRAAEALTDDLGAFELPHVDGARAEGAEIEVTARWHTRLTRPLPPPGQVVIHVVSRRRALLERLVDWARRRGRPWSGRAEPTPAEVARIAREQSARDVEAWAQAVERAAYGPEAVDEGREMGVRQREPEWRGEGR